MFHFDLFFKLLMAHALGDFALQSEWMAKHKNPLVAPEIPPGPGQKALIIWPYVLTAHALLNGLAVYLLSGSVILGALETVAHWIIDLGKCKNIYNLHVDQILHLLCKIAWSFYGY